MEHVPMTKDYSDDSIAVAAVIRIGLFDFSQPLYSPNLISPRASYDK